VNGTATPGEISVGVIAGTRMTCPEHESAVEARFLAQLGSAQRFGFRLGRLAITYVRADGMPGTMLFDGRVEPLHHGQ
jgi:heat shock protein HslJ